MENFLPVSERLDLRSAAQEVGVHTGTLLRWRLAGVRGVKLRCQKIGGRYYTSRQWLRDFVSATNGEAPPPTQRPDIAAQCRAAGV